MPVDSAAMQVVFAISQETGLPFLLHHEAEDAFLPELERMLAKYPGAKLIWCHVGRNRNPQTWKLFQTAEGPRSLLKKYPNLYFDIVQSPPGAKYHGTGYVEGVLYKFTLSRITIEDSWKALFEEYPDRFVIGTDANSGRFKNYDQVIGNFRTILLPALSRQTAEKIAWKNAWRLMTGKPWADQATAPQ
jgi:predicted TIM-barrel fold metal-dependent hydrolase